MTALSADRNTPFRAGDLFDIDVAADTTIYAGALVAVDASGNAVPGSTATTLTAIGRAEERADNAGGTAGDIKAKVRSGVFRWANSAAGDEITAADVGTVCYIVDDQTVAKTDGSSTRSAAGVVVDVDDQGVWVAMGAPVRQS